MACALVVWPVVITASVIGIAWLRAALRRRRAPVALDVQGLVGAFLPASLLGPALAGLGMVAVVLFTEHGASISGAVVTGVFVSFFYFWPLGVVAFLLGVIHRLHVTKLLASGDDRRPPVQDVLVTMTGINVVSVACEMFWLTRPMDLRF